MRRHDAETTQWLTADAEFLVTPAASCIFVEKWTAKGWVPYAICSTVGDLTRVLGSAELQGAT